MTTDIEIRNARSDDFEAIAGITNHYIATTAIHFGVDPLSGVELERAWARAPRFPVLVATRDATVIAYAKTSAWRDRAAYANTCEAGIYVDATEVGGGVGKRLYTALLEAIAAAGFHTIVAGIVLPNERSLALHRALGFVEVGVFREVGHKFDQWHDVSFWQRMLPKLC